MLVLSRQRDETIMIGDEVEITVVDIRGDKVRLGITAPRHIQVHRKEVYDAIKRENQQAAGLKPQDVPEVVDRSASPDTPKQTDLNEKKEVPEKDRTKQIRRSP
ncbi:MAG: carbon storage regulator CsrA [Planctomycetota bacterium]|jgi:carbon storage regulator